MILYSIYPEEFILAGLDLATGGPLSDLATSAERAATGASGPVRLLLERGPGGGWRIGRLMSSDPYDFLDPALAPGRQPGE